MHRAGQLARQKADSAHNPSTAFHTLRGGPVALLFARIASQEYTISGHRLDLLSALSVLIQRMLPLGEIPCLQRADQPLGPLVAAPQDFTLLALLR